MLDIITYISMILINSVSVICYAITSFGNGVLYQLGWHICYLINSNVCDGSLDSVLIHVTLAHVFTFPMQIYLFRERINWTLALLLTISQQFGLYFGLWLVFTYKSIWFFRGLAILFFLTAIDMIYKELIITINIISKSNNKNMMMKINSNDSNDNDNNDNIKKIQIEMIGNNNIYGGDDIVELGIGGKYINNEENKQNRNQIIEEKQTHKFYVIDTFSKLMITLMAGFTSGVSGGIFSVGGPSLMWFIAFVNLDNIECRATLAVCFCLENIGRVIYIFFFQNTVAVWNEQYAIIFIVLTTSSLISLYIGNYLAHFVDQTTFRRILIFLLSSGSLLMAVNGLDAIQTLIVSGLLLLFLSVIFATSYFIVSKNPLCCDKENEIDKSLDQFMNSESLSDDDDDKEMNTLFGNKKISARIGSPTVSPKTSPTKSKSIFQKSLYSLLKTEENNNDDERSDNVLF